MKRLGTSAQGLAMALKGNLFSIDEILELSQIETVEGVLEFLGTFPYYKGITSSASERTPQGLGVIERRLRQSLIDDAHRLRGFLHHQLGEVMDRYVARYEVDNIKAVMKWVKGRNDSSPPFLYDLKDFSFLHGDKLLKADSFDAIIETLHDTRYGPPLQGAYEEYDYRETLFPYEIALDLFHFDDLWKSIDALGATDRGAILPILGTEMDLRQVQWILRFKEFFRLSAQDVSGYILFRGYLLNEKVIEGLASASNIEEFLELVPKPYASLLKDNLRKGTLDFTGFEISSWNYIYKISSEVFLKNPISPGVPFAYLIIKRIDIDEIISILEGKRYNMGKDELLPFIIRRR